MKHPFLKKLISLLEKEVCHEEIPKDSYPMNFFKPFQIDKKSLFHEKPSNIAAKCLKSQETVLSEGVSVKGELYFDKQLRINGSFEGSLHTQGKLIVGSSGIIKGNIHLDEAEIHGKVIGDITVTKLTVGPTAEIVGNIQVQFLDFQNGAKFTGHLLVDSVLSSNATPIFEEDVVLQNSG